MIDLYRHTDAKISMLREGRFSRCILDSLKLSNKHILPPRPKKYIGDSGDVPLNQAPQYRTKRGHSFKIIKRVLTSQIGEYSDATYASKTSAQKFQNMSKPNSSGSSRRKSKFIVMVEDKEKRSKRASLRGIRRDRLILEERSCQPRSSNKDV